MNDILVLSNYLLSILIRLIIILNKTPKMTEYSTSTWFQYLELNNHLLLRSQHRKSELR